MLIQNIAQLNKFIANQGGVRPELITTKLAESKILVTANIAKLVTSTTKPDLID